MACLSRLPLIVVAAALFFCGRPVQGEKTPNVTKGTLKDISGRPAAKSLASFSVVLDVEPKQIRRDAGVVASIAITNSGKSQQTLVNPFELIQFQLTDDKGFPIKLATKPPAMLVHRATNEGWRVNNPIQVLGVTGNGQAIDITSVDDSKILFSPGAELRVTYRIDHVRQAVDQAEKEAPIAEGRYGVAVTATLIDSADTKQSRILQVAPLTVEFQRK